MNEQGRIIAVYKNQDGTFIILSPICTHQGCTVEWNQRDRTWDCPCHGSSFSAAGKVLEGPAEDDLAVEKI